MNMSFYNTNWQQSGNKQHCDLNINKQITLDFSSTKVLGDRKLYQILFDILISCL